MPPSGRKMSSKTPNLALFPKTLGSALLSRGATKQTSTTDGHDSLFATDGDPLTYSKTAI